MTPLFYYCNIPILHFICLTLTSINSPNIQKFTNKDKILDISEILVTFALSKGNKRTFVLRAKFEICFFLTLRMLSVTGI